MTTGIETRGGADLPGPLAVPVLVPEAALGASQRLGDAVALASELHTALSGVLLGTPVAVTTAVIAALSGSHLLIEDVPGVGKTVLARALATSLGAELSPRPGSPRPAPVGHHRGHRVLPGDGDLGVPTGTRLRPRGAPRRDEPHPAADPVGTARIHGGAAGVGGR